MRSSLSKHQLSSMSDEELFMKRRDAWHQQRFVGFFIDDPQIHWKEREIIEAVAIRLYGKRGSR